MLDGCSNLTAAPALPATTLASSCYFNMFSGCSSLNQAPELPATTLANHCYYGMLAGCSSLTQAPALPATTLASACYYSMFSGCSSLTQSPSIKTYTSGLHAYGSMLNMHDWNTGSWGKLTTFNWPDLTLSEAESMVLNEFIFGYEDPWDSISITCKDGSGVAYFNSEKSSWVFILI